MATGYSSMHQYANCCAATAAVSTSAHIAIIMDTAVLAVSIIILLAGLLVRIG